MLTPDELQDATERAILLAAALAEALRPDELGHRGLSRVEARHLGRLALRLALSLGLDILD